ncbi:MAG: energy transducer TonB [Terriglobales bacterium]
MKGRCVLNLLLALGLLALPNPLKSADQVERILKRQYEGQEVVLRHFNSGSRLEVASNGELLAWGPVGSWTLYSHVYIEKVKVMGSDVVLDGRRQFLVYDDSRKTFEVGEKNRKKQERVVIVLRGVLPGGEAMIRDRLAQIFLKPNEHLYELVPVFWRRFLCEDVNARASAEQKRECPVDADFREAPKEGTQKYLIPPKAVHTPDPEYTNPGRGAKLQGRLEIWMLVDREGKPAATRIAKPLGMGLDESAFEAVNQWRFQPARNKDTGEPAPYIVKVEVSFRLWD